MRKMEEDINTVLDEELNNCIQKLRDATFGYEVRTFITEYEELMLRKSSMITQKFVRDTGLIQRTTSEEFMRYKRKLQHLIVLQIVQGISIMGGCYGEEGKETWEQTHWKSLRKTKRRK